MQKLSTFTIFSIILIIHSSLATLLSQEQPISPLVSSYEYHVQQKTSTTYGFQWISVGPTLNGARAEAVQADPAHPGTIYAGFGSGGLWKTINNGMSWQPIFENMPSLGIGDIALAPSDSKRIYLGTGESLKKPRNFTMPGTGMYRSDDGGINWKHIGLDDAWHIGEISVHPDDPDIVLVAAQGHFWSTNENRGIFRTENGGKTWDHALYINDYTGANDIVFSPANPQIAYATTWENHPGIHGEQSGVYKSTNGGKSWERMDKGIQIDKNTGRIGIAASYQDPQKAYAFIDQRNRESNQGAGEIYKTVDGGASWAKTHDSDIMTLSVVGWYFVDIYVNPQDDEEIYALGVRMLHSKDGGKSFDFIEGEVHHLTPSPAQTLHLDHCELWINPGNSKELILANDGGIFHSYDNGASWLHLNNIPTGEFYDIEIDHSDPYLIYGGTQDDATVYGIAKELNTKFDDHWKYLWIDAWSGGDGCITLVDPNDSNTVYFSMQNGGARRMDILSATSVSIRPRFPKEDSIQLEYNFITPYMLSRFNSDRIYMAGNFVMKSDDRGDHWELISPDLIKQNNHQLTETAAGALAESYFEEGTLYMGTDRGTFWFTDDGGSNWQNRSEGLVNNYIRNIYPSKHQNERIYLQQTGLNYDDFGAYLYVSEDNGLQWTSIRSNLPDHPVNVIVEDPFDENVLFAGTYRGVYISENRGGSWSYFGTAMPDASIADIIIDEGSKDLIAATHGRGIYVNNLSAFYANDQIGTYNYLFEIPDVKRPGFRDTHKDVEETSIVKVPISYYLKSAEEVELRVKTNSDSLVWSKKMNASKGFNQFRWDLVISSEESNLPYFIHYNRFIEQGEYVVELISSDGVSKRTFWVK